MKEKTTKYTNQISVFFILLAAFCMIFLIPSNQININTIDYSGLIYIAGLLIFIIVFVGLFYYLPMLFVIKYSCFIHLPYIINKRIELDFNFIKFTFVNRNKYQQLCVVRC